MILRTLRRGARLGLGAAKLAFREARERLESSPAPPEPGLGGDPEAAPYSDAEDFRDFPPVPEVSCAELDGILAADRATLLDCREAHEREAGYIEPSIHIALEDLAHEADSLNPKRPLILYCLNGLTSPEAAAWLRHKRGFEDVKVLSGGIVAWYSDFGQARIVVVRPTDH